MPNCEEECNFDEVIMAICPRCHKVMEVCQEAKTYCQDCDFSWSGGDPCENCEYDVPGYGMCRVGGFKKVKEAN